MAYLDRRHIPHCQVQKSSSITASPEPPTDTPELLPAGLPAEFRTKIIDADTTDVLSTNHKTFESGSTALTEHQTTFLLH